MPTRSITALALALVLGACGGPTGTTGSATTQAPGSTSSASAPGQPTPVNPGTGESIDSEGIQAAADALQALDSWTFSGLYYVKGPDAGIQTSVTGTERRAPDTAVDATHHSPTGDLRYIRIGDDIWASLGAADSFYHYDAATSKNLIDQYEPSYIAALADSVGGFTRVDYEPIGPETINNIATVHYQADERQRENLAQLYPSLAPEQWAADAWIATDGGYLVKLAWGPQSAGTAQATVGFTYEVAAVHCECPITPPTNVASP